MRFPFRDDVLYAMELKIMDDRGGIEAIGAHGSPLDSMYWVVQIIIHVLPVYD